MTCPLSHGHDQHGHPRVKPAVVGLLCAAHRDRLDADTAEIGMLWCELNLILDGALPREASQKTRHLKAAEAPAPLDLTAVALRDPRTHGQHIPRSDAHPDGDYSDPIPAVVHIVASWLLLVAEERPIAMWRFETRLRIRKNRAMRYVRRPVAIPLPTAVIAQLDLLQRHHDWIAGRPWIDDYVRELTELRKALAAAVRDHAHRRIGTCRLPTDRSPVCGGTLLEENGSGVIRCTACRAQWITPQEHARLAMALEDSG